MKNAKKLLILFLIVFMMGVTKAFAGTIASYSTIQVGYQADDKLIFSGKEGANITEVPGVTYNKDTEILILENVNLDYLLLDSKTVTIELKGENTINNYIWLDSANISFAGEGTLTVNGVAHSENMPSIYMQANQAIEGPSSTINFNMKGTVTALNGIGGIDNSTISLGDGVQIVEGGTIRTSGGATYIGTEDTTGGTVSQIKAVISGEQNSSDVASGVAVPKIDMIEGLYGEESVEGYFVKFNLTEDVASYKIESYLCDVEWKDDKPTYSNCETLKPSEFVKPGAHINDADTVTTATSLKKGDKVTIYGEDVYGENSSFKGKVNCYKITLLRKDGSGVTFKGPFEQYYLVEAENIKATPIVTTVPEDNKLSNTALAELMTSKNTATYEKKVDDKLLYSWTFDGSKMTSSDFNLDLNITVGSSTNQKEINKLIPSSKDTPYNVEFSYHGALPKGTSVKINVSAKYKNDDVLTLYYYNPETKKLEEVLTNIKVVDGYATVGLEHCSEYVFVKDNKASNNAQTSSLNVIAYGAIGIASLVGIVCLVKGKKRD